jgi:hypothetical protein
MTERADDREDCDAGWKATEAVDATRDKSILDGGRREQRVLCHQET